jgi:AcrR family transcriptional regulator
LKKTTKPSLSARKRPSQRRSAQLVGDILEAASRVLARDGALRFTTVRVAAEAGVSVGSLYQYFPSKEALLFRLQTDEWEDTWSLLEEILADARFPPRERLRRAVLAFFRSERQEAALRVALDDAGALFRTAPEARAHVVKANRSLEAFIGELLPASAPSERAFFADFVMTSMSAVAERITSEGRGRAEVDAWAQASAEMVCLWLDRIATPTAEGDPSDATR